MTRPRSFSTSRHSSDRAPAATGLVVVAAGRAQTGDQVLLVANRKDAASREVADYYRPRRSVPVGNVCWLDATTQEEISWDVYQDQIEKPIAACLERGGLREKILYIALTLACRSR